MHLGCTSETIQWRKSARMGAAGPGASGSTMMSVYLVVAALKPFSLVMEKVGSGTVSVIVVSITLIYVLYEEGY
jgi:hypothetical protein